LLINWIDHKTINTSRNSRLAADGFVYKSDPGALWVAGGPGGETYENVNGDWVDLNGTVVQRGTVRVGHGLSPVHRIVTPLSQKVNVYTVQGKLLGVFNQGQLSGTLPGGTYFMAPVSGERRGTVRVSVSRKGAGQ
jgi:hypothetical protein